MGGQLVLLGTSPVMWRTAKQKRVCFSTMESEFMSMTDAVKELIWFDRILKKGFGKKFLVDPKLTPELFVDNLVTIDFLKSPIENHHTKHIYVNFFSLEIYSVKMHFISNVLIVKVILLIPL